MARETNQYMCNHTSMHSSVAKGGGVPSGSQSSSLTGKKVERVQFRNAYYEGEWNHDKNWQFVAKVEFQQQRSGVRSTVTSECSTFVRFDGCDTAGVPEGRGVMSYDNGDIYEGNFKDGQRHGRGQLYCAQTRAKIDGIWKKGVLAKTHLDGGGAAVPTDPKVSISSTATKATREKENLFLILTSVHVLFLQPLLMLLVEAARQLQEEGKALLPPRRSRHAA